MICKLIDFAVTDKVYENVGILKNEFFSFSGTERVKRSCQKSKFQRKKDEYQSTGNISLLS